MSKIIFDKVEVIDLFDDSLNVIDDKDVISRCITMWNAEAEMGDDDDHGWVKNFNAIWNLKHPDEKPADSDKLQEEYDLDAHCIMSAMLKAISWMYGVDIDAGCRWELAGEPIIKLNEKRIVFYVYKHDL